MVKITRSYPAPASLAKEAQKSNGSYEKEDVIDRLRADFYDKCYICELKDLTDPEVEHRLPHKDGQYPERKFDWDNLFWSCVHCNGVKNKRKYDDGIIDCCKRDPEQLLRFEMTGDDIRVTAIRDNDRQAILTAELIYETFNQRNTGIRKAACDIRVKKLQETMNILYRELENYRSSPESGRNRRAIRSLLSREAAFAAFTRGYVRARIAHYPGLEEYVS